MRLAPLVALVWMATVCAACAVEDTNSPHVIRAIPHTDQALIEAHTAAAERTCIEVPDGQPIEAARPGDKSAAAATWETCGRLGLLSLGMTMTDDDRSALPRLTRGMILDRIDNSYLSIQAGIVRDAKGTPSLLDRPLAVVANYGTDALSQEFAALAQASVRDLRSLGLFVEPGEPVDSEHLRTLVLAHKSMWLKADEQGGSQLVPGYELMFVRARVADGKVTIHGFATSEGRTKLHYFGSYDTPGTFERCDIASTICFTSYGFAGLKPTARATRGVAFRSDGTYTMAELDDYVAKQGLDGTALDHASRVLDAIIDGKVLQAGGVATSKK